MTGNPGGHAWRPLDRRGRRPYVQIMPSSSNTESRTTLQTVERALSFLEFVAEARTPPRVRDVAEGLGLNITTTYHLFNTLLARNYITRDSDGKLRVGTRATLLYNSLVRTLAPSRELRPIVERLAAETDETAYLTSLVGTGVVIQAVIEGSQTLRVSGLNVGYSGQEHVRASGKAVLAQLSDPARTAVLEPQLAMLGDAERQKFLGAFGAELEGIRSRGYATDDQGYERGICCVAAPYFGSDGQVVGSITISAPAVRYTRSKRTLTTAVIEAAAHASRILGHQARDPAS
jgi:DNA-binding IclR family transcriptional regulator